MNAKPPVRPRGSTERVLRSMYASEAPPEVDDDAGVRQSLRLCLEAAGARVLGVATGGAALEALDRGHFDVVFLDLWLGAGQDSMESDFGKSHRTPDGGELDGPSLVSTL
jgi:CheY-like chemotaxis protein